MTQTAIPHTALFPAALAFLQQHEAEHLAPDTERLVAHCVAHLVSGAEVSAAKAHDTTMQALGELECRRRREYIDCSRTTSFTLFLVDSHGKRHAFTVADLIARIGDLAERQAA